MNFNVICAAFACLIAPSFAEPVLRLHDGAVWTELDTAAWQALPRVEVTGKARDNADHVYSGVAVSELLKKLSAPSGETLRGKEMNRALLLAAADGYQVVFSLAELDPSFRKETVILADRVDGRPLTGHEGPLMIVAAGDSRHSRWIRQVKRFMLVSVAEPVPKP